MVVLVTGRLFAPAVSVCPPSSLTVEIAAVLLAPSVATPLAEIPVSAHAYPVAAAKEVAVALRDVVAAAAVALYVRPAGCVAFVNE